jgi:hypothetical protein
VVAVSLVTTEQKAKKKHPPAMHPGMVSIPGILGTVASHSGPLPDLRDMMALRRTQLPRVGHAGNICDREAVL